MHLDVVHQVLMAAWDANKDAPTALRGKVSGKDVYALQLRTLEARKRGGSVHVGWKLGQTNRALRESRGETVPAPGFLLGALEVKSGGTVDLAGREVGGQAVGGERAWFLEPELALVLRDEVCGPGVTPERIRQSVAGVAAAFELVRPRRGWEDRDLQRAVNGSTAGHVLGPLLPGCPSAEDMDALVIETHANDEVFGPVRGGDVNDNPLSSVAWLANYFAQFEVPLAAGSVLLTGTYSGLLPMRAGQHWRTTISGLEPVELMTR